MAIVDGTMIIGAGILMPVLEGERIVLRRAGGFKDITRIASSRPELWRDICLANREAVASSLAQYVRRLNQLKSWITKGEAQRLELEFARANEVRRQIG